MNEIASSMLHVGGAVKQSITSSSHRQSLMLMKAITRYLLASGLI
jgi:hypothetical protein